MIVLYVDEFIITSGSTVGLRNINSTLRKEFSMTYLGLLRKFIGLEVNQKYFGIMINQSIYIGYFLKIFHMNNCKETPFPFLSGIRLEEGGSTPLVDSTLYNQLIGSILYLTHSRPYLSYAVSDASRYMQEPHEMN